jgi:hypothetical protein
VVTDDVWHDFKRDATNLFEVVFSQRPDHRYCLAPVGLSFRNLTLFFFFCFDLLPRQFFSPLAAQQFTAVEVFAGTIF